jgi:hypothetical protein
MALDAFGRERDWSERVLDFVRYAARHFPPRGLLLPLQQVR